MSAPISLITGANKGIGFETARQLGQLGHTVLLGARDAARGEAAVATLRNEGLNAHFIALDVNDEASIQAAAQAVESQFGHVDALINNAGVNYEAFGTPAASPSRETLQKTLDTNLFGLIAVTEAFLPLVKKSAAGRIVNLSSVLGSLTLHADPKSDIYNFKAPAYDISKAAVNMYTTHLAWELRKTPIKVNAAHPGWVKTDMGGEEAPMELVDGAKTSVHLATLPADGPTGGFFHLSDPLPW